MKQNTVITTLNLKDSYIHDRILPSLVDCLLENQTLKNINLSGCKVSTRNIKKLINALSNKYISLNLSRNQLYLPNNMKLTFPFLNDNPQLTYLDLSECQLEVEGINEMAKAFRAPNLNYLAIRSNDIEDEGLTKLLESISSPNSITYLDLSDNEIGDLGMNELCKFISSTSVLQTLNLSGNIRLGKKGITLLTESLMNNQTLTELNLNGIQIGVIGMKSLSLALSKNKTLKHLELWGTSLFDDGLVCIFKELQTNTNLQFINLRGNRLNQSLLATKNKTSNSSPIIPTVKKKR